MKKIFRNLKFGLLLCAGAFAASCSDVEDAMDEIPYTRVLTPLNFEADVDAAVGTDIKFSWSAVSNADAYLLELFEAVPTITTDDKGNEVEVYEMPEYFDSANAYKTIEVAKDAVPYTVKDLAVDKTFWARVQGVNAKIESSNWACLAEAVSTSAVRKALNPQAKERTSTSVTLSWDNADDKEDLTSVRYELVVPVEGVTATTLALSKEQIEDCEAKIDELEPGTNYKFTLLFGKSGSRGILTAYTRPSTEGTQVIKNSGELVNAISSADGDLELLLEYNNGELYDLSSLMTLNATENIYDPFAFSHSLAIYGESTAEGAKPVIKLAIKPTAGCNSLHFEDVSIDGGNQCGVFVTTGGSIDGDAEFVNCEITGFTKGIWSGATDCNVTGTLLYENVYAHDINPVGAGAGDFIDIRGGDYGNII
ncbi:MAG: fibronectin type III domain-containing protein, partial [Alistipes sp.]|nr:fibronectin type III domain-containing protein [Alistipes sp.]